MAPGHCRWLALLPVTRSKSPLPGEGEDLAG
jgi:hypothetical protein